MGDAFGRAGAALLNVFVAFNAIGTLTVYLIIIGNAPQHISPRAVHPANLQRWSPRADE
jgi:amino acid permease